jgi:hypothetical protein
MAAAILSVAAAFVWGITKEHTPLTDMAKRQEPLRISWDEHVEVRPQFGVSGLR